MIDEELTGAMAELEERLAALRDAVKRPNDKLHALATPTPELPDKRGYYLTQQHGLLLKDWDDAWSMRASDGCATVGFWGVTTFTKDSNVIVTKLSPDAFPLVPISEVILPSEHIEEEDWS